MAEVSPGLLRAYRATGYAAGGAVARIGRRSPALDAVLAGLGRRQGGFLTAWNPFSRRMPPGWNHRMQARLCLAARRLPFVAGQGVGRGWQEAHLLLGADTRRLAVLARRFRQAAMVLVRHGQAPRLRLFLPAGRCGQARPSGSSL